MTPAPDPNTERIVVLAPKGRDALLTSEILARSGLECVTCRDVGELCARIHEGAATVLVADEALAGDGAAVLAALLREQEPWSDLPIVLFTRGRDTAMSLGAIAPLGNVSLLDRPLHVTTLVAAVRAGVRARRRQYAARAMLGELAAAVRERDEFLAMLGHELRNPLSAIVLAAHALGAGGDATRAQQVIERQAHHLARLIDDLLDVSRITAGKITLRRERVDLGEVARRAVDSVSGEARAAGIRLDVDAEPGAEVEGDPVRLEQIASNLLTNAVKYTPAGGRIAVSARASGDCAEVVVEDTGVGIAPEVLPRIFEPFTQAATTIDRSRGGMGLGLALARGLVELHHGTISAGSEGLGRGSRFAFRVPLAAPRTAAAGAPAPPGPARSPRGTRRRVLVVEDNQDNRETLEEVLHVLGHEVASASDGLEGLSRALAQRPEVMVVDIGLPGIDGYELARRVRAALGQAVRLVALTGYGRPEERRRAADAGFDVHLTKPVDPPTLASAITGDAAAAAVVAG